MDVSQKRKLIPFLKKFSIQGKRLLLKCSTHLELLHLKVTSKPIHPARNRFLESAQHHDGKDGYTQTHRQARHRNAVDDSRKATGMLKTDSFSEEIGKVQRTGLNLLATPRKLA